MKVDLSRYYECPSCHTFQGNLRPCRKCGWHIDWNKRVAVPELVRIKSSIKAPDPNLNPVTLAGLWPCSGRFKMVNGTPSRICAGGGIIGRWEPCTFTWQANLESLGIIGYSKVPTRARGYCLRIMPDKIQEAKKLMAHLEDVEDGEDECR